MVATLIAGLIVLLAVVHAIYRINKDRKSGGCSGGCPGCSLSGGKCPHHEQH